MFGGQHDMSSSYFTKVAITTATEAGDRAVICTNYNRLNDSNCKRRAIVRIHIAKAQKLLTLFSARRTQLMS